jgi:hypothetical protein
MKSNFLKYFVIGTFVTLYLVVSIISTIHVVQFFDLTNPKWLSVSLAVAFEIGAAASLASLIALDKMNKVLVWMLFIVLTCMQAMGNTYYAYINIQDFTQWSELFGLSEEDLIYQKRILSIISGAILPLVALGFIKSLVDYIKPEETIQDDSEPEEEKNIEPDPIQDEPEEIQDISEPISEDKIAPEDENLDQEEVVSEENQDPAVLDELPEAPVVQEEEKKEEKNENEVIENANSNSNSRFSLRRPPYFS